MENYRDLNKKEREAKLKKNKKVFEVMTHTEKHSPSKLWTEHPPVPKNVTSRCVRTFNIGD